MGAFWSASKWRGASNLENLEGTCDDFKCQGPRVSVKREEMGALGSCSAEVIQAIRLHAYGASSHREPNNNWSVETYIWTISAWKSWIIRYSSHLHVHTKLWELALPQEAWLGALLYPCLFNILVMLLFLLLFILGTSKDGLMNGEWWCCHNVAGFTVYSRTLFSIQIQHQHITLEAFSKFTHI